MRDRDGLRLYSGRTSVAYTLVSGGADWFCHANAQLDMSSQGNDTYVECMGHHDFYMWCYFVTAASDTYLYYLANSYHERPVIDAELERDKRYIMYSFRRLEWHQGAFRHSGGFAYKKYDLFTFL